MKNLFLLGSLLFMVACQQSATAQQDPTQPQQFGEGITADNAQEFDAFLTTISTQDSLRTKVKGTVESVCKKKGCWMTIVSEATGKELFVKFKDYGFFMPKDIEGREVVMDGIAYREVTSVDELRHYAEDEGKSKEEIATITNPEEELKFMASGVVLLPKE